MINAVLVIHATPVKKKPPDPIPFWFKILLLGIGVILVTALVYCS